MTTWKVKWIKVAHKMDQWWALENRTLIQKCKRGGGKQKVIRSMTPKTVLMIIKQVADACECGDEPSCSVKCGEFLD